MTKKKEAFVDLMLTLMKSAAKTNVLLIGFFQSIQAKTKNT